MKPDNVFVPGIWAAGRHEPGRPKAIAASLILAGVGLVAATAWTFGALRIPLLSGILAAYLAYLSPLLGLIGIILALYGLWRARERIRRATVLAGALGVLLNVGATGLEVAAFKVIPTSVTVRGEVFGPSELAGRTVMFRGPDGDVLAAVVMGDPSGYGCFGFFIFQCQGAPAGSSAR